MGVLQYCFFFVLVISSCYVISFFLVKRSQSLAVTVSIISLLFFILSLCVSKNIVGIFNIVKSVSVFFPLVLYAFANFFFRKEKNVPTFVGLFFSLVLGLNTAETILVALRFNSIYSYIYIVSVAALSLAVFFLKWDVKDSIIGFKNKAWMVSFGICLTYLYLFLFPEGAGLFAFFILAICYVPFKRVGHQWFAYRAYSLFIYFNFIFTFNLLPSIRYVPKDMLFLFDFRNSSVLNIFAITCCIVSVICVYYYLILSVRRKKDSFS